MDKQALSGNVVWLNETDRIASFHHVEGYQLQIFDRHEFLIDFLHALQKRGYRFQ